MAQVVSEKSVQSILDVAADALWSRFPVSNRTVDIDMSDRGYTNFIAENGFSTEIDGKKVEIITGQVASDNRDELMDMSIVRIGRKELAHNDNTSGPDGSGSLVVKELAQRVSELFVDQLLKSSELGRLKWEVASGSYPMGLLRDERGPVTADEVFRTSFKGDSVILTKGTYTVLDGPLPGFSFSCYHLLVRGVAGLNLYYYDNGRGGTGIEKVKDLFEVASTSLSAASI